MGDIINNLDTGSILDIIGVGTILVIVILYLVLSKRKKYKSQLRRFDEKPDIWDTYGHN